MTIQHIYSLTQADGTATSVVRPSDWNSAHSLAYTLTGNTISGLNTTVSGTNVLYAGSGGLSIGGTNGSIVFSAPRQQMSQWENFPMLQGGASAFALFSRVTQTMMQPVFFQHDISANFIRFPVTFSATSTSLATTINTAFSCSILSTFQVELWAQMSGASSRSLSRVTSSSVGMTQQWSLTANANGSQWTLTYNMTYPISGVTSAFTTSTAVSAASFNFSTNSLTAFTGNKFIDIPLATLLNAGNYWIGIGHSSTTSTQAAGVAGMTALRVNGSILNASALNSAFQGFGIAANASAHLRPGLGMYGLGVPFGNPFNISDISSTASNIFPYLQIHRWD